MVDYVVVLAVKRKGLLVFTSIELPGQQSTANKTGGTAGNLRML